MTETLILIPLVTKQNQGLEHPPSEVLKYLLFRFDYFRGG